MLRAGMIDAAVAGAAEMTVCHTAITAFDRVGAMARREKDFSMAPQPYDKNRDGLVMGEGAAVLILETESHARKRGANILAELAGYGSTAHAFHVTAPHETGAGGAAAMQVALEAPCANVDELGYINAHGTGTVLNDQSETRASKSALGEKAYQSPVSSTMQKRDNLRVRTISINCTGEQNEIQACTIEKYYEGDPFTGQKLSRPSHKIWKIYKRDFILKKLTDK